MIRPTNEMKNSRATGVKTDHNICLDEKYVFTACFALISSLNLFAAPIFKMNKFTVV